VGRQKDDEMKPDRLMSFGGDVRCAGEWRFEGGGFVSILIGGDVSTEDALKMVDTMVALKREELARKASRDQPRSFKAAQNTAESDPSVRPDCAGADTAHNADHHHTPEGD
jgi:hypothetical protein